ncbi:MAG: hypothetical protein U1D30_02045 [Planctomycetota bacterium]
MSLAVELRLHSKTCKYGRARRSRSRDGSIADVCLDVIPDYTLADVAMNIDRIDLQLLKRL